MDTIIRNVQDIDTADRSALEHLLGQKLRERQQVVIQLVSLDLAAPVEVGQVSAPVTALPEWCHVFEGLSDQELQELDQVILSRADLTRSTE